MTVVTSAFGRSGPDVLAVSGDYAASQVTNDSGVDGATVADAYDTLAAETLLKVEIGADLGGTTASPQVIKLQGRTVSAQAPNDGDRLTWVEANNRWEPVAPPPVTPTGYDLLADFDFTAYADTAGNDPSDRLRPITETFNGINFTATGTTGGLIQNVFGAGYRLAGSSAVVTMRPNDSAAYLITDVRQLPGYVAGREYGCLAVVDYYSAIPTLESRALVGCFNPNPYYPFFNHWVTLADDSGFACSVVSRGDTNNFDYKPVIYAPVVGYTAVEAQPDRMLEQYRAFTPSHAYIFGSLRREARSAKAVAGPFAGGAAPYIESLMSIGTVETLWNGNMDDLRWGVCWSAQFNPGFERCYIKRMIFYQSKV